MSKTTINESITWKEITPGGNIYERGNSTEFRTGDWRSIKPILDTQKCKQCLLCTPVCPDSSIPVQDSRRLDFNYYHCKGCGICAKVCPFKAIEMVKE